MKLKSIEKIEPKTSRCISVDALDKLYAVGEGDYRKYRVLTHNSVVQQNIIIGCVLRPDNWRFLGIDLKKVELSRYRAYSEVVQGIATELEDALIVLRFAQQTMMTRYEEMEASGENNFLDLPEKGQALMVMVDEAGELLSPSGVKALSEYTILPTPAGEKRLGDISVGDVVYDNYGNETVVTQKYTPDDQKRYDMTIRSEKTQRTETFISGSEHNWVAYFTFPDGETDGPHIVDTSYLQAFKAEQDRLPAEERTHVRFKRG